MAGPLIGVTVRSAGAVATEASRAPRRALRLYANERPRFFGDLPGYGFVLQAGEAPPAADSIRIPGTPLVLTRGEPTQITVFNRLGVSLGVHWHGIEVESYFDGVPGVQWCAGPARACHRAGRFLRCAHDATARGDVHVSRAQRAVRRAELRSLRTTHRAGAWA